MLKHHVLGSLFALVLLAAPGSSGASGSTCLPGCSWQHLAALVLLAAPGSSGARSSMVAGNTDWQAAGFTYPDSSQSGLLASWEKRFVAALFWFVEAAHSSDDFCLASQQCRWKDLQPNMQSNN